MLKTPLYDYLLHGEVYTGRVTFTRVSGRGAMDEDHLFGAEGFIQGGADDGDGFFGGKCNLNGGEAQGGALVLLVTNRGCQYSVL